MSDTNSFAGSDLVAIVLAVLNVLQVLALAVIADRSRRVRADSRRRKRKPPPAA